ncbi:hypothetical protein AbraIFM66951_007144 [Aspergillus brasiliensis]|uniref:Zn(2)-C6 fungal-type domain-containing protein n=1 Tax=Aspergillus brasiliensis TaxID=319629 RepID=A0A9W6DIA4_9EURO|nr:hypothetical protein AbraCBS73388_000035 [Aspergillus brasiliensis]GKZ44835.1 hypothetical protein AbraIFM66951_007144 [Aspergillus brasiliensis]
MGLSYNTVLNPLVGLALLAQLASASQVPVPILKDFDDTGVLGGLYRPNTTTPHSRIAIYIMHAEQDYTSFVGCTELQKRGFTVFCANNEASKSGYMSDINFEDMMLQANTGLAWLRNQTDIDKVVILGHSGGGAMMAQYQNVAENGVSACNGPEKIYPCSSALASLEPADGLMLLDANYGSSTMGLLSLNPAIEDETKASKLNRSLNIYNPNNGFSNGTQSNFTADFKERFVKGIVARNNRVLEHAQNRLKEIEKGNGMFGDDEPLTMPAALYLATNNLFISQDVRTLHHTTYPWTLLEANGTSKQIIPSVRVPSGWDDVSNSWEQAALKTTVRRYLSTLAIRANESFNILADNLEGIDYESTQMAPAASIKGVSVPLLTMGMTGHYEYLNAEKIHLNAVKSNDTSIAFVQGAQHGIYTCTECESYPGEFGDTVKTCFDYVAGWLSERGRFLAQTSVPMESARRYNVERSCLRCHQRKVRCDKSSPCGSCIRANVLCQYPGPNRVKRRPPKVHNSDVIARLESLERSIAALAGNRSLPHLQHEVTDGRTVSAPGAGSPSSKEPSPSGTTAVAEPSSHDGLLVEDGRYINEQLLSRVLEDEKDLQSAIGTPKSDASSSRRPLSLRAEGLLVSRFVEEGDIYALHPCQWQATQLWQTFLNRIDPIIKILHVPSTQPRIFAAINQPAAAPADLHALLFAIFFAATTSMLAEDPGHEQRRSEVKRYQQGLELALYQSNFLDSPTLTSLQAMSIYQMCLRYYNSGRSGWTMRGLVIRAAQSIGLHRDGRHFKLSPLECELRRRLWWHICTADSRAVEDHGVGVNSGEEVCDTAFPANIDDQDLSATATVPPESQNRWTEMTASLITTIVNEKRLELHRTLTTKATGKDPAEIVREAKEHVYNAYTQYGDLNIPIQRHGMLLGENLVLKMEMYANQKALQTHSNAIPVAERRELQTKTLDVACQALERTNQMFIDPLLRGYRWLSSTFMPYFLLTYILWHLCVYPLGVHVERAWRAVNLVFDLTEKDPLWPNPGPKWAIITRLRDKALHIRDTQVAAEQAARSVETQPGADQAEAPMVESFFDFVNWDMGVLGFPDWTGLMQSVDITGFEHLMDTQI